MSSTAECWRAKPRLNGRPHRHVRRRHRGKSLTVNAFSSTGEKLESVEIHGSVNGEVLKKRELILGSVVFLALVALLVYALHKHPFHWNIFVEQLKLADWSKIGIAFGCI